MRWVAAVATIGLLAPSGCVTTPTPTPAAAEAPLAPKTTIAILHIESDLSPQIADALNEALKTVDVRGADEVRRLKVALEVVQLQIECLDMTDACFTAAGKSLGVTQFFTARLAKEKKGKGIRVTLVRFDVERGTTRKVADRVFKKPEDGVKAAPQMVAEVAAE